MTRSRGPGLPLDTGHLQRFRGNSDNPEGFCNAHRTHAFWGNRFMSRTALDTPTGTADDSGATVRTEDRAPRAAAPRGPNVAEERLRTIVESAPVGLIATDSSGKVVAINRAGLALLGDRQRADVLQTAYDELVAPASHHAWCEHVKASLAGQTAVLTFDVHMPDESSRTLQARSTELQRNGKATGVVLHAMWEAASGAPANMDADGASTSDAAAEIAELSAERDTLATTIASLQAELEAAQAAVVEVETLVQERDQARADAEQAHHEHSATTTESESVSAQLMAERDSLAATVAGLEQDLETARAKAAEVETLAHERDQVRADASTIEQEAQAIAARLTAERDEAWAEIERVRQDHASAMIEARGTTDQLATARDSMSATVAALERDLEVARANSTEVNTLIHERDQAQATTDQLTRERDNLTARMATLEQDLETARAKAAEVDALVEERDQARAETDRVRRDLSAAKDQAQATTDQLTRERDNLTARMATLEQDLETARAKADELKPVANERDQLRIECDRLSTDMGMLTQATDQLRSKISERKRVEEDLTNQLAARADEANRLEATLRATQETLEARLEEAKDENAQLTSQMRELRSQSDVVAKKWEVSSEALRAVMTIAQQAAGAGGPVEVAQEAAENGPHADATTSSLTEESGQAPTTEDANTWGF